MKSDRVTLRADDAITAFSALRTSIKSIDELLLSPYLVGDGYLEEIRAEKWEAYQRIAKALLLQPTLDKVGEKKSA